MNTPQWKEKVKKDWRLFWGEAPEHSLKSRRGYDIEDFWLDRMEMREKELDLKIGMLRQWLNEDRITDANKMVTSEEIKSWLARGE